MSTPLTVLFAGGGTGGHIFPNLAVWERIAEADRDARCHFALSNRQLDVDIVGKLKLPYTQLVVKPWSNKPWDWPTFLIALNKATKQVEAIIDQHAITAVVATGGYVSGPAMLAARRRHIPAALVNLDAVPGKANSRLAGRASKVFSVYESPVLPGAQIIGLPLRRSAVAADEAPAAREKLGLDPDKLTLLVTGGSQGAQSVNEAVLECLRRPDVASAMQGWQVLHLTGTGKEAEIIAAYEKLGVAAKVAPFCHLMGLAWRAASLAITRSGAGAVAEAWANATPCIFMPYPFHKDDHQRLNAGPMVAVGGAVLMRDHVDAKANAAQMAGQWIALARHRANRDAMAAALKKHQPVDGAAAVAQWVSDQGHH